MPPFSERYCITARFTLHTLRRILGDLKSRWPVAVDARLNVPVTVVLLGEGNAAKEYILLSSRPVVFTGSRASCTVTSFRKFEPRFFLRLEKQ